MDLRDAHLGRQVEDLDRACTPLHELFGLTSAEPISGWPVHVRLDDGDEVEHGEGRFPVSRQGPPYVEVTEHVAGSKIWRSDGQPMAFHHHLGFRVDDVAGLRVELAGACARPAFEQEARA